MNSADYLHELEKASVPIRPAFPDAEYGDRVTMVKTGMDSASLDLLLVTTPPNICYLTGYDAFGVGRYTCLLLPRHDEAEILVPSIELPQAFVTGRIKNIASYEWYEVDGIPEQLALLITKLGMGTKRIGVELKRPSFSVHMFEQLRSRLPQANFHDCSDLIANVRLIKSQAELTHMRRAARLTQIGIDASIRTIGLGKTDNDVASAGFEAMVRAGSEFFSCQPIVAAGYRSGLNHCTFKREPLKGGEPIILEYGACYERYTTPLMRTVVIGTPSPTVHSLGHAVINTLNLVIENVRPGRTGDDVARAARKGLASLGPEVFFHGAYGYSVGLSFPPMWDEGFITIAEGADEILRPGMTLHLPIAVRIPGRCGVAISETIVVTEAGCEVLSVSDRRELIVV